MRNSLACSKRENYIGSDEWKIGKDNVTEGAEAISGRTQMLCGGMYRWGLSNVM